ncbi:MAG: acetate kinase [Bacteroidales bacterium]|nr:acetate kinase [Bacteroidales bacterium]
MKILVLNCGSSSIKYQVLDMKGGNEHTLLAKGLVERIGMEEGDITHSVPGNEKHKIHKKIEDHTVGIKDVLSLLTDSEHGVLGSLAEIKAVGHRIVHGGEYFTQSCIIDARVIEGIEKCSTLAPLHNPAGLLGIKAVTENLPSVPQVAVFDTSFHQTMPECAYMYGLPYEYYEKDKIRKYGFHGTSHRFVSKAGAELAELDYNDCKIITCHLGNGSSVTAVKNGRSVDTSLGMTTIDGLLMGTRCGALDPGVVTYVMKSHNLSVEQMDKILSKQSGFVGVSGVSSDARDLEEAEAKGDKRAKLTLEMFRYGLLKQIGAYSAAMGGVDLIVFTGGIGENDPDTRAYIAEKLGYLGVDFDFELNSGLRGKTTLLTKKGSKVKVAIVATNEELVIASDTMKLVKMD